MAKVNSTLLSKLGALIEALESTDGKSNRVKMLTKLKGTYSQTGEISQPAIEILLGLYNDTGLAKNIRTLAYDIEKLYGEDNPNQSLPQAPITNANNAQNSSNFLLPASSHHSITNELLKEVVDNVQPAAGVTKTSNIRDLTAEQSGHVNSNTAKLSDNSVLNLSQLKEKLTRLIQDEWEQLNNYRKKLSTKKMVDPAVEKYFMLVSEWILVLIDMNIQKPESAVLNQIFDWSQNDEVKNTINAIHMQISKSKISSLSPNRLSAIPEISREYVEDTVLNNEDIDLGVQLATYMSLQK